jgi:hypothetical protein
VGSQRLTTSAMARPGSEGYYTFIFMIHLCRSAGKAVRSEAGKTLGSGLFFLIRGKKFSRIFNTFNMNFDINIGCSALGLSFEFEIEKTSF